MGSKSARFVAGVLKDVGLFGERTYVLVQRLPMSRRKYTHAFRSLPYKIVNTSKYSKLGIISHPLSPSLRPVESMASNNDSGSFIADARPIDDERPPPDDPAEDVRGGRVTIVAS